MKDVQDKREAFSLLKKRTPSISKHESSSFSSIFVDLFAILDLAQIQPTKINTDPSGSTTLSRGRLAACFMSSSHWLGDTGRTEVVLEASNEFFTLTARLSENQ
jgi:hypothetical protein